MMGAAGASGDKVYVDDVFSTYLYKGTGTSLSINNGIDLAGEGGLVWIKRKDSPAADHALFDTNRGVDKVLFSNLTLEYSDFANSLTQFGSSGFTVSSNSTVNASTLDNVSWTFRKAPGFFDVVTYTGNGVSGKSISHSLESVPGFIIIKNLDEANAWNCWHRGVTSPNSSWWQNYLTLNTTNAPGSWTTGLTAEPTSTSFTVGTGGGVNNSGVNYVAYVFAHDEPVFGTDEDESIIKCGGFTIPGSGTFDVDLGFEPQFILYKQLSGGMGTPNLHMHDNMRGLAQTNFNPLYANTTAAESSSSTEGLLTVYPTGFKSTSSAHNAGNYIYMAIRRPDKPPESATEVFDDVAYTGNSSTQDISISPSYADSVLIKRRTAGDNWGWANRLTGPLQYLTPNNNNAEATRNANDAVEFDRMSAFGLVGNSSGEVNINNEPLISYSFKRAPGFMDVVAYTGNGTAGTSIAHNLEAIPEFIICKCRNQAAGFWCYHKDLSTNYAIRMDGSSNGSVAEQSGSNYWNSSTHSATTFTLGNYGDINGSGKTFISYLFSTLPGISKVGSYSGTGSAINVDCGFTAGARFVMIKRKDGAGDWYVWDSARGIVSGDDPYLFLNTNAAEVTNTDYVDPLSSGFTVTSSAPDALNVSGGTYIFLAIT